MSKQIRGIKTKEKIYNAGIKLFQENGFENVSIEDICNLAKVGVGTFYHYYPSKLDLYSELFVNAEDYFKELNYLKSFDNPRDFIIEYFKLYCKLSTDPGIEFASLVCNYKYRKKLLNDNDLFEYDLLKILKKYQDDGKLNNNFDVFTIKDYLYILARGVVIDWTYKNANYDIYEKIQEILDIAIIPFLTNTSL